MTVTADTYPAGMVAEIERFLSPESEATRAPGLDLYREVIDSPLFFPLQRPAEMVKMFARARTVHGGSGPQVVMEVGADKGGSLYHWVKCFPTVTTAIACEIRGTPYFRAFERAFPAVDFLWLDGVSSHAAETVDRVTRWLGRQRIDCLFLDGDKRAFDRDLRSYLPLMADGGIVFLHDVNEPGNPRETLGLARRMSHRTEEIVDLSDTRAALAREAAGVPAATTHESWLRHWRGRSCGVGVVHVTGDEGR